MARRLYRINLYPMNSPLHPTDDFLNSFPGEVYRWFLISEPTTKRQADAEGLSRDLDITDGGANNLVSCHDSATKS